jgi:gamma-glutamyltranspeptidase/glutathione hydrolase
MMTPRPVTGRPVSLSTGGMVTSPHALASSAGVAALRAGGSAVDAAIAASAALSVLYPHMTGIGGDAFWLIHEAAGAVVHYLDGAGRAARRGTIEAFRERGLNEVPLRGALPATLTTPGAVASWCEAHRAFGRLPLRDDLAAAVALAEQGFPVTARLAQWIRAVQREGALDPAARAIFCPHGDAPAPASLLVNPDLAAALRRIGAGGRDGFYAGETAHRLAELARTQGGFLDEQDLAEQDAGWGTPIRGEYRDLTLYQTPPPTQGFCVLEMLNLVEPMALSTLPFLGADHVHHLVQAKQIAYNDRDGLLADPCHVPVPVQRLISKAYAGQRRALMDPLRALPWDRVPSFGSLSGDTVYIAVVDRDGNAVSLIHSLYGVFGSGVVAPGTGIVLQNRSAYFSLEPDHPNHLAPGKKPLHTLIASMGFRHGKLWSVLGCMGADGQPQIQLQAYVGMLDFGLDIQQAVEMPRWLSGRFGIGEPRDQLNMEGRFDETVMRELERRGHRVNRWTDWHELAGHAHGIVVDPRSGVRMGGADPRSDGAAVGC